MAIDLKKLNDEDLIKLYPRLINELKNRKIIRTNNIVWGLFSIAHEYYDKGDHDSALNQFKRSLAISEEIGDKPLIARNCNRIGAVLFDKGIYDKAEKFIEKSLSLHRELGEEEHASLTTAHLYLCYKNLGKEYDKNELNNYIKKFGIKDIHYRDNFILYKLLDNESCLKAAYNQIQDKLNVMEDELREKILNYPIPKQIIEEYNKVMN
tara:strand:+ start:497 stop:1123 length:627 start_codon:yes stop_codon:yes gene_type:complete